jgi:hypothetical protein
MFRNKEIIKFGRFKNADMMKHIHQNFINMGMLEEDNLFLESEMIEEADGDNAGGDAPAADAPKADAAPKGGAKGKGGNDAGGDDNDPTNLFDGKGVNGEGDEGGEGGEDKGLFGEDAGGDESDEALTKGLPSDDQYYVVIIKDLNKKLVLLNDVSLKLLSPSDETEAKLIEKIRTVTYSFNRFVEQYTEYDSPKALIIKLKKTIDTLILYIDTYIKDRDDGE